MLKAIRHTGRFYGRCARWAVKGTLETANAWFWILGVPVVAGAGYVLKTGPKTVPDHFPQFLLFMLATVGVSWIILFLIRFIRAPAHFDNEAHEKIEHQRVELAAFNERLQPRIKVFLEEETYGVTQSPTEVRVAQPNGAYLSRKGPESKWAQVSVMPATEAPLVNCEAWLLSVRRIENNELGSQLAEEHVHCEWSQLEEVKITIHPGRIQRFNLFSVHETEPIVVANQTKPPKIRLREAIQAPGSYRIKVLVTADNVREVTQEYVFTWHDFKDVTLTPA